MSKTAKFLGGKSALELIHSLYNFEFLNPCCTKRTLNTSGSYLLAELIVL